MELKSRIRAAASRLWRRQDGTLTLEFLILAPIMFWTFIATLAYFDAYRTEAVNKKAAMTIADMISREPNYVNDTYLNGAYGLLKFLTRNDSEPQMRVSVLRYHAKTSLSLDDGTDHFHVVWSTVRNSGGPGLKSALSDTEAKALTTKLPDMGEEDRLILVETWSRYDSAYNLGLRSIWGGGPTLVKNAGGNSVQGSGREIPELRDIVMESFIFTAPRFSQTCFNNTPNDLTKRKC